MRGLTQQKIIVQGWEQALACRSLLEASARSYRGLCISDDLAWLDQAGASFFTQAVTVAADRDHMAVVKQAVQDRGGDQTIVEDAAPFAHAPVAGDQNAAPFVPAATSTNKLRLTVPLRSNGRSYVAAATNTSLSEATGQGNDILLFSRGY